MGQNEAAVERARLEANRARYRPGQKAGHYESYFLRANHPVRPLAFWIRYTIFSPDGAPEQALGELWAIHFDGESGEHLAVKKELALERCAFSGSELKVHVGDAFLERGKLEGSASAGERTIAWDLSFRGDAPPLFLLPAARYEGALPRAKSLVGLPLAEFDGFLFVDGNAVDVVGWIGSLNHNWGSRHTDHYAWGQVAGFDTHPESFLEVATARMKLGPLWTPFMTLVVLRHDGQELALNSARQALRARGSFRYFAWSFATENEDVKLEGRIEAPREAFVGLRYMNPPGGIKHCLNSKIAACELTLLRKRDGSVQTLSARHRAAFEILTDDREHGVEIRV